MVGGHIDLSLLLFSKGAKDWTVGADGGPAVWHAAKMGLTEVVVELVKRSPGTANYVGTDGSTPLLVAVRGEHLDIVRFLVKEGKSAIDAIDKDGTTALMIACATGSKPIVKILLDHGARVTLSNHDGHSAAMFAALSRSRVIHFTKQLLKSIPRPSSEVSSLLGVSLKNFNDIIGDLQLRGGHAGVVRNLSHVCSLGYK